MTIQSVAAELRLLAARPASELRARHNAVPELLKRLGQLAEALDQTEGDHRRTSTEVASLAGLILETEVKQIGPASKAGTRMSLQTFHSYAQTVAGSALSQRAEPDPNQPQLPIEADTVEERAINDAVRNRQAQPQRKPKTKETDNNA